MVSGLSRLGLIRLKETRPAGGKIALWPGSRVISASGEFPGNQLTNWGALGVLRGSWVCRDPLWGLVMTYSLSKYPSIYWPP